MSSRIHRASELSRIPGSTSTKTTTTEYGQLSPVAKPGKACSILDMNLRSPLVSKQAPPSPPTSTPTQPPPVSLLKRKSVNFNDQLLRSARSVPNHRSRANTIASIPRTSTNTQNHGSAQQPLFSSRSHADQQKRARLSLAAPQLTLPISPSTSRNRSTNLRLLQSNGSPLGAQTEAKKKLARFYYDPSSLQAVPRRPKSPTLSTSAGSKQAGRRNPHRMLTDEDGALLVYSSDESSDSDYEVAFTLLSDTHGTRRTSSCSRLQRLQEKFNDDPVEELTELRPILKKTRAQILLAETVQQATAENGRPRLSLDPLPLLAYRRVIATTSSKTPGQTNSTLPGDTSGIALAGDVTALHHSAESLRKTIVASTSPSSKPGTDCAKDTSDFHGVDSSSLPGNPDSAISDAIEESLLSSARSCIITLQASLLPPPDEMRLDPVSPLAKLTSPQKLKLSKLGTLDGSPREPRGLLPRAPTSTPQLDLPKNTTRTRGRSWLRGRSKPSDSSSTPTTSSVTSGPLRTPESSPVRQSQSLPRGAITLREVEDAYISLHDHLDALVRHWKGLGPPCDADQQLRLRSLFADDAGACLMKCLVREVENLCRHDDAASVQPPATSVSNQPISNLRDEISRMMPLNPVSYVKQTSSNDASAPIPGIVNKSGASTNEIRRRVAEIETGQAALRCVAILWSWPSCMVNFDDCYTQRLLSLLLQIPKSSVLRRKKNLSAIGLMNHIFKLQRLKPATIEPHVTSVVDAIASTLYLSAGKSGDKGQKVLCLGLSALEQLTTQMPQHVVPNIGKFLEPLLASLTAPDSPMLRHQAAAGLGALINCTKAEWDMSYKTHARVQLHESRISAEALLKLQQGRKDAFKEKLSTFALAYYNDQNTFIRWLLLAKQFKRSLNEGDVAWVISVMATMIVLIGKRVRKLDPPLTRVFMPTINHLLKDSRTNHLATQLWDYYIYIMFQWSIDNRVHNTEQIWALDPVQLPFIMQLFRSAYFVPGNTLSAPTAPSPNAHNSSTANSDKYKSLLQPGKDSVVTSPQINQSVPNTSHQSASSSGNSQRQSLDGPQSSSHHIVLSAFLYGAVGFIKDNLAHPPVCLRSPSELLAMTRTCSRFHYLDTVWDEMIDPFLPNIMAGPHDEHRLYVYEILAALCRHESPDSPSETSWTLERLVHPPYHQPPIKPESTAEISLEALTNAALSSAVVPVEIPALDSLWICSRYDKVLPVMASSISSIQYIKGVKPGQWVMHPAAGSERIEDFRRVGPRSMFRLWQELIKSMASVYQTCDWIFDTELSASVSAIMNTLEQTIQIPACLGLRTEKEPHDSPNISIFLFRHLYGILKHGLGLEFMNRKLIATHDSEASGQNRKISLFSKTFSFVFTSPVAGEIANTLGPKDWVEYCALAQSVMDDFITARKVTGFNEKLYDLIDDLSDVLQACSQERLQQMFGKSSINIVIELLKIVEHGVLLDEPSLTPSSAIIIDACLKCMHGREGIDQATQKQFIETFTEFLSRLTQGSLKILLDSCRTSLSSYLYDDQNHGRQQVYTTLLSKLRKVDLTLLMSSSELSALVLSPFRNQSSSSTAFSEEFLSFVKTSAHDFIGAEEDIVEAVDDLSPISQLSQPSQSSAAHPKTADDSPMSHPDHSQSPPSSLKTSVEPDHPHTVQENVSNLLSLPAELSNPHIESQSSLSVLDKASEETDGSCSKSHADTAAEVPAKIYHQEQSDSAPLEPSHSLVDCRLGSPLHDNRPSQERIARDDVYALRKREDTPETSSAKAAGVSDDRPDPSKSTESLQIEPSKSKHGSSPVRSLQLPSELRTRNESSRQHFDPRLSPGHRHEDNATKTPVDRLLSSNRLDVRDPALFGPIQSQESRIVQTGVEDLGVSHDPWVMIGPQAAWQMKFFTDPQLADPKAQDDLFDEIRQQAWYNRFTAQMEQSGPIVPKRRPVAQLNSSTNSTMRTNQSARPSGIPNLRSPSFTQPCTPTSLFAHEHRVSPITTSLGALGTLAPFAKRQAGKCLSFDPQQSASLEPAQSAREMLQNMSSRKPQGSSKGAVETGTSAGRTTLNKEDPPSTPQAPSESAISVKRKRDEPQCNLADQLNHPSPSTSTFAAVDLVSRGSSVEPSINLIGAPVDNVPSPSSLARKSPSQASSLRKSPVRPLLSALPDPALNNDDSSDPPPPRKKTKCSKSATTLPREVNDEVCNTPERDKSSSPPATQSQPDEVRSDDTTPAKLEAAPSNSPGLPGNTKANRRGSEIRQLLQDAKQSEILLESVSSSQLGRISKTASDILVSRARVTRSSSRRSSSNSNERLPN
ncbi:hypothetical protein MJO29_010283 [Puccinia striiformis f. sp. tritici]|uniref:hypothetical protein n=1 Tax=Puccinia striiformis f. sp. tritici TaxID=168172 RepID=UPI002007EE22|nr:hypothetical protein Pst134EA_019341 [Puccinia striiformis f. sp. tritici]KAH9459190.1 hypothetical protein Pst134EA_019341 [Puccinia striiformis f. sp. tritici]KAI7948618.1 hypothetical protein MJO29_010283 [Puccinia striiformis f. sp. tritici]